VLSKLYTFAGGPAWVTNTNWMDFDTDVCQWGNVMCSFGNVVGLFLDRNSLVGSLPHEVFALADLTYFSAQSNMLTGTLPAMEATWGTSKLQTLSLGWNSFSGAIPSELGLASELLVLGLDTNSVRPRAMFLL